MNILAISEHFHPRVGGTVEYVSQTCASLQAMGHDVNLVVPGSGTAVETDAENGYKVTRLGVGWPTSGDPNRETRYRFCREASDLALSAAKAGQVDLVHVLFGLFVNETLETESLSRIGIPCVTTIHNVPPQECSRSWPGDTSLNRIKDSIRLRMVARKNRARLEKHSYDLWVVPSGSAANLLAGVRPDARIEVIGHGYSEGLLSSVRGPKSRAPESGQTLKLLTVGGWVPHKRQHLIPEVASLLRKAGVDFIWDLVGPSGRVPRYQDAILRDISSRGLEPQVRGHGSVSLDALALFYSEANLYVQPSTEEGFCMTALDAAAAGLPVIGSPAGALPEICLLSGGTLIPSTANDLASSIEHFYKAGLWSVEAFSSGQVVRDTYTWRRAAAAISALYVECRSKYQ
jgi:glycosyltransferase involved in cell wall biosynthesis